MRRSIEKFISNPKKVFLADGIGALLTGTLLIAVVIPFSQAFGMPQSALYYLSALAFLFSIYSFSCWYFKTEHWPALLIVISVANCLYCILISILLVNFSNSLTPLGFAYFIGEIIIIISLVSLETWAVKKKKWTEKGPWI